MATPTFPDHLSRIVWGLLHYRKASVAQTAWFRSQRHDSHLCPAVEAKLTQVLDFFERYQQAAYNIQGIRDGGVDVLLRYLPWGKSVDATQSRIGLQIKSHVEIGEDGWFGKLKAQAFEALEGQSLVNFYVLLCADLTTKGQDRRVQNAQAELTKGDRVSPLGPEYVYTFLHLREEEIAAFIHARLSDEDAVHLAAVESLDDLTPTEAAILIEFLVGELDLPGSRSMDDLFSSFVDRAYRTFPDVAPAAYFQNEDLGEDGDDHGLRERGLSARERFEEDFSRLDARGDLEADRAGIVRLDQETYRASSAIILDATARYNYRGDELKRYAINTLLQRQIARADELTALLSAGDV